MSQTLPQILPEILPQEVFGLVLIGGASKRMGEDKFSLLYGDKRQFVRAYEVLRSVTKKVFFSLREAQLEKFNEVVTATMAASPHFKDGPANYVCDTFPVSSPLSGILSAQEFRPDVAWLVIACDLPFLTHKTLANLIQTRKQTREQNLKKNIKNLVTCYLNKNNPKGAIVEPLCAIYEAESHSLLKENYTQGIYCPRKIISNFEHKTIIDLQDSRSLYNTNYLQEYEWAQEKLK